MSRRVKILLALFFIAAVVVLPAFFLEHRREGAASNDERTVLQIERNACGPASLEMILRSHGIVVSEESLRKTVHLGREGARLSDLVAAARQFGLSAEGWRLDVDGVRERPLPAIIFLDSDHYAVLDSIDDAQAYLRDPALGTVVIPINRLRQRWTGEVLLAWRAGSGRLDSSRADR